MIDKLTEALRFQQEALNLRHHRQQVLASNIANADTPHYKSRDIDFASELSRAMAENRGGGNNLPLAATSPRHISGHNSTASQPELLFRVPEQPSLDGNTVDMERERVQFADNSVRYQASLVLINGTLQSLKSAMQPE